MSEGLSVRPPDPKVPRVRAVLRDALDGAAYIAVMAAVFAALVHFVLGGWR